MQLKIKILTINLLLLSTCVFPDTLIADLQFLIFTDSHIVYPAGSTNVIAQNTITMINNLSPLPKFMVVTGDIIEAGLRREYDTYNNLMKKVNSSITVYNGVTGNQETSRGMGLVYYRERICPTNASFIYDTNGNKSSDTNFDVNNAFHFLVISGSLANHGVGHYSRTTLNWVKNTLDNSITATCGRPVIVFSHHPPYERADTIGEGMMIDNERILSDLFKKYNISYYLVGHVHSRVNFTSANDRIPTFSFNGVMDDEGNGTYGGVGSVSISSSNIEVSDYTLYGSSGISRNITNLPQPRYPKITYISPLNDSNVSRTTCAIEAKIELYQGHSSTITAAYYQIDDGGCPTDTGHYSLSYFKQMSLVKLSSSVATATANINIANELAAFDTACSRTISNPWYQINGIHRIKVRFDTSDGNVWYKSVWVNVSVRTESSDNYAMATRWRKDIGADIQADIAVDNNQIFVNPYGNIFYCFDTNGNELWRFDKSVYGNVNEEMSGPVVDSSTVYFGSYNGNLFALNRNNGSLKWRYTVPDDDGNEVSLGYPDSPSSIYCTPKIDSGTLYFGAIDGYLYAINLSDGMLKWKYRGKYTSHGGGGAQGHKEIVSTPAVFNNAIYFSGWSGYIQSVSSDGIKKWDTLAASSFYYAPANADIVVSNGYIFGVGAMRSGLTSAGLYCVDAASGTIKWSTQADQSVWASLGVNETGTRVYSKYTTAVLGCYNSTSAVPIWTVNLGDKTSTSDILRNRITEKNGIVYIPSCYGGQLFAVKDNGSSGTLLWKYKCDVGYLISAAVPYNGNIYIGTMGGHLLCIEKYNGGNGGLYPPILTVNASGLSGQILVTWITPTTGESVSGYKVYRSTQSSGPWDPTTIIVNQTTNLSYTDVSLKDGTTYYYNIASYNDTSGNSEFSGVVSAYPYIAQIVLSSPSDVSITNPATGGKLNLFWTGVNAANLAGYKIYRRTSGTGYELATTIATNVNTYQDTGLTNGIRYYYVVTSYDITGNESGYSTEKSEVPTGVVVTLSPPSNVTVTDLQTNARLRIQWDSVANATIYHIWRSNSNNGTYQKVVSTGATTSPFVDSGLLAKETYYYKLQAADDSGNVSGNSSISSAFPTNIDIIPPPNVTGISITDPQKGNKLILTWNTEIEDTDLAGYRVYRSTTNNGGGYQFIGSTTPAGNAIGGVKIVTKNYQCTGLINNVTYYFIVTSYDTSGNESLSSTQVFGYATSLTDNIPPAKPSGLTLIPDSSGKQVELNWSTNMENDLKEYHIFRAEGAGTAEFTELFVLPKGRCTYIDIGLKSGKEYQYYICAMDINGNQSVISDIQSVTPTDTQPPVVETVEITPKTITQLGKITISFYIGEMLRQDPALKVCSNTAILIDKIVMGDMVFYKYAYTIRETDLTTGQVVLIVIDTTDEAGLKSSRTLHLIVDLKQTENKMYVLGNRLDLQKAGSKAVIHYYLLEPASYLRLKVYNTAGELVRMIEGDQKNGWGVIEWDGTNSDNNKVSSGVYFAYLESDVFKQTSRIVVIK